MKQSVDQWFFDLAINTIAGRTSREEETELRRAIDENPKLHEEFERLREEASIAREALILVAASNATDEDETRRRIPDYAIVQLQSLVRANYPRRKRSSQTWMILVAGIALLAATVLLLLAWNPISPPPPPVTTPEIQVATLAAGLLKKSTPVSESMILGIWPKAFPIHVTSKSELDDWSESWPPSERQPVIKVTILPQGIFGTSPGQIRIDGRWKGRTFQRTMTIHRAADWEATLQQARQFVDAQIR